MAWEPAWSGSNEPAAAIVAGRLRAEGLHVRLTSARIPRHPMHTEETWVIHVPLQELALAHSILRESGEGPNIFEVMTGDELVASNARLLLSVLKVGIAGGLLFAILLASGRLLSG